MKSNPADDFVAPKCLESIEILYQDDDIVVIDKPSGLLSLSGKHPLNKDSVHHRIVQDFPNALMCHRLDLGTSGVMIIALNKPAIAHINRQFELRSIKKTYQAVLMGSVVNEEGVLTFSLKKGEFPRHVVCELQGKYSESHYKVVGRNDASSDFPNSTKVIFTPKTGRTHQLRIHSQAFGHSILGDDLYGDELCQQSANRLMLNAYSLEFAHPTKSQRMTFLSESLF
ncbi:RluA family pseudouridine synthase [Marinicellulosiphila megalodicopiae]|uniref:RluA family pseudouridine synthase n=1 Tax=Marinicellulosiphila megalodicopiae TaxID=2724896 RepID=UPI003BAEC20C